MAIIPFYGAERPDLFAIERKAMDRPGLVIKFLAETLPMGLVLDVGAGDGFTAQRLQTSNRTVVALEPARAMMRHDRDCTWVQGEAERLPFHDGAFDAAYATWAYFFSRGWDPSPGIEELHRVGTAGGPLVIVDNAGDDEFCLLADADISANPNFWAQRGFEASVIQTEFEFDSIAEAETLLSWYFGDRGRKAAALSVGYNIAVFSGISRGPNG